MQKHSDFKVGDRILILSMKGEPEYSGKSGVIRHIDDIGQLHGSWGGLAVDVAVDRIVILEENAHEPD